MALLKNSFSCNSLILCGSCEGEPLSPPEGEAACGGGSPYPLFWFDFSINLLMIIAILGDGRAAGAEVQCAKSPQERLLVSLQDFYRA
jgi:hypothetical protein